MRNLVTTLAALLAAGALVLSGCEATQGRAASPSADAVGRGVAVGGTPTDRYGRDIFDPLDLPTPNGVRSASGRPGHAYWQQRVDYTIRATLDAEKRRLTSTLRFRYVNNSPEPLPFIWMSLEQNLFDRESVGARAWGKGRRFGNRDGFDGGYEITRVTLLQPSGGTQQTLRLDVYDTVGRIDLPTPVAPNGGEVQVELDYAFDLPPYGSDRMGVEKVEQGTIFQVAQWFPAVCAFDDVSGWNTLPYLGAGEFHTNFGDFDVSLTVPRDHIVGATGELVNASEVLTPTQVERLERAKRSRETVMVRGAEEVGVPSSRPLGDGPLTWRFVARDVRTFAWTSSEAFIWDAAAVDADASGVWNGSSAAGNGRGTLVMSLYPKEGLSQWVKSTDMLRFSIEHYNRMWFRYPYPTAINVNGIVGGMEYPMVIFCRARTDERALFGVTTHEIGHNWFPMIVSNDERRHAWQDEGFNSFINYYCNLERYPESVPRRGDPRTFVAEMRQGDDQPMMTHPDRLADGRLGRMMYAKPAAALVLLRERVLGPERFDRAFKAYIEQWAFKHPQPADFFRLMENESGMDLAWFWRGWFYENGTFDQSCEGFDNGEASDGSGASAVFKSNRRIVMPAVYEIEYTDGSTERRGIPVEAWFSSDTHRAAINTGGRRIKRVTLDPDRKLPDQNDGNDSWPR